MYSSGVRTRETTSPVGRRPVGISRAPGTNNERNQSQFLFWPAGPEITSYNAATIASIVATSFGSAAGACAAGGIGGVCAAVGCGIVGAPAGAGAGGGGGGGGFVGV